MGIGQTYVLTNENGTYYLTEYHGRHHWSPDMFMALTFVSKEQAEKYAYDNGISSYRVTEYPSDDFVISR